MRVSNSSGKRQGAVVHRGGEAEAVVDEILFARAVSMPHAVELGDGDVGLVDEEEEVAREVVEERGWGLAGEAARHVAGVVFDAVAEAHGLDHFEVEHGALVDALRLDEAAFFFQLGFPFVELGFDAVDGCFFALGGDDVVGLGVDRKPRVLLFDRAEEGVDL